MDHNTTTKNCHKKKRRYYFTLISLTILLILILLTIIVATTVFRPKHPITTVTSITLQNIDVSLVTFHINLTLSVNISVTNPNKLGFKYAESSAYLDYNGHVIGQAPIPAGQISAQQTVGLPLKLNVMADRVLKNVTAVVGDVVDDGVVSLTTRTRIEGKVLFGVVRVRVVSFASCNFNVSVVSKSILDNDCNYRTRLS